jgi:hypothetical protein
VHRSFASALESGHRAERAWVDEARLLGRSACHGRKLVIRQHSAVHDHCEAPDALGLVSIEVKERSLKFTGPDDYPFPTVFVDDLRGLHRERLHHFAYVYISKVTGAWVWLTPLDRNEEWREESVYDRGRGHMVPTLVAPRSVLRPSETLLQLLYPHTHLELVDADIGGAFRRGGGEAEERERHVEITDPAARGRGRKTPGEGHHNVG